MNVSVIIASGRPDISQCLESVLGQRGELDFEIVVVHDESNRPVNKMEGVRYIECLSENPAVKRNVGVGKSSGEILAFIDDDAVAPLDWIERGLATLTKYPDAAGCGGPNLPPENQSVEEQLTDAVLASKLGSGSRSYAGGGEAHVAGIGEIHLVNFFVKRDVFDAVGGFNEALGYGAEDSEFIYICHRMAKAEFIYDPGLCVTHRRRPFGKFFFSQRYRLRRQNGRILWLRPGMYVGSVGATSLSRRVGLFAGMLIFVLHAIKFPILFLVAAFCYMLLLAKGSLAVKNVNKIRWMLAVAALHAVSAAGMFAGLIKPHSADEYRDLLRRPG